MVAAAKSKSAMVDATEDGLLHWEYAWVWVAHQLVPFADKVFGIAGAMDNRPLNGADWTYRLPFVALCFVLPKNRAVLALGHVVNIGFWVWRNPAVWDYMCWVSLTEACYVGAFLLSGRSREMMRQYFLPSVRAMLITLYLSAAFWKLTTSFLSEKVSCANTLVAELAAALFGEAVIAPESAFARGLMLSAPAQIVAIEFLVPVVLWYCPTTYGIPITLLFHQTINLMPVTYAGGFSIAMCVRMALFNPGVLVKASADVKSGAKAAVLVALVAGTYLHAHRGAFDSAGALFLFLSFFYCKAGLFEERGAKTDVLKKKTTQKMRASEGLRVVSIAAGFTYGFLFPIFGIMAMASSTMYGNVRQFDGVRGNHLLVPTGLFQEWYRDEPPRSFLGDAFGGGMVRLEASDSSVFDALYYSADITHEQPAHARAILAAAIPAGNPGRYFEFYAARNYFERDADHAVTMLHDSDLVKDLAEPVPKVQKFAMPAYELRRALWLAKIRGEPFELTYAKLPKKATLPTAWRLFEPKPEDLVSLKWTNETATCARGDGNPCDPDELVHLPRPPIWLRHLLHPYPTPLIDDGVGDEVYCTT